MGAIDPVRQSIGSLASDARVRSRVYRLFIQMLIASVAWVWIGWWAAAWVLAVQCAERFVEPYWMGRIAPLRAGDARKAEWMTAGLRAFTGALYALSWAPAWAIGGDAAGFFAAAMLCGALINALVYFSHSKIVFAAAIAPPVLAGLAVATLIHGFAGTHYIAAPVLLITLLRSFRAQQDQMALFESLDRTRAARAAAEEASRVKTQFMTVITHELRTPLNAIINYAELLAEDLADRPAAASDASRIGRSGRGLLGLIDNVIDYTLLDCDQLRLCPQPTDLRATVLDVMRAAAPLAAARGNALSLVDCPSGEVLIDRRRLSQCAAALIDNACRFTDRGEVRVQVEILAAPGLLRLHVADTGCGVDQAHHERIFEPFYQVDAGVTRSRDGLGLGLALTRRFARLMGGDVTIQSTPGAGSIFTLTARCEPVSQPSLRVSAAAA
jgi:signal transduction histidine kinase